LSPVLLLRKTKLIYLNSRQQYLDLHKKYNEDFLYSELKNRSRKAFEYLYDNYSPALYGVIKNILQDEESAHDALQETFVKIWNSFHTYDPAKSRLYTWMLNVARNHAIDKLRQQNNRQQKDLKNDKDYVAGHSNTPAPVIEGIGLKKLVESLEQEQKVIIDLLYFKGFTQSEAAEQLNIPLGTVKSRVRLAMNKLRKYFV
jgi:RNA polymerase sigma factor (sigma-70 family)